MSMVIRAVCQTTALARNARGLFKLSPAAIQPNSSKIQGVKLFATQPEEPDSSWIKDATYQLNDGYKDIKDDEDYHRHIHKLNIFFRKVWKSEHEYSDFGENAKLCRYDRSPPYVESINSSLCEESDIDSYNLHYNIWKNIVEFSVHPNISELKQQMKKLNFDDDDSFCCHMANLVIKLTKTTPDIED